MEGGLASIHSSNLPCGAVMISENSPYAGAPLLRFSAPRLPCGQLRNSKIAWYSPAANISIRRSLIILALMVEVTAMDEDDVCAPSSSPPFPPFSAVARVARFVAEADGLVFETHF